MARPGYYNYAASDSHFRIYTGKNIRAKMSERNTMEKLMRKLIMI